MGGQREQPPARRRRVGRGWPRRWPSTPTAVSIAPLGVPVVPEVDTTTATSSSISSPARNDVVSKAVWRGVVGRHRQHGSPCRASTSSTTGSTASAAAPDADGDGAQDGYAGLLVGVARVVQRPALGGQPSRDPLDVLGRGQFVGDLGDQHADVDVVELAAVHQRPAATAFTSSSVRRRLSSANSGTRSGPGTPPGTRR